MLYFIKCFFLSMLPKDLATRIKKMGLDYLTSDELDVVSAGKIVFILKKKYFMPENSNKLHQLAEVRNMSVEEYSIFLTGLPLTTAQSTVTDDKIIEFLYAHYIGGRLMIPSINSNKWFFSLISHNGYSIEQIMELYGLGTDQNMDDMVSTTKIEDDMMEYESSENWLQDLYARNPLIGNERISEKIKEKLYFTTKKYIDQILREPRLNVPLAAKMQITLMVITFAKDWDMGDDSGFWRYITAQFGYRDDNGKLRDILCDYLFDSMRKNSRWFISSEARYQYKSTIVTHALTTKKSWLRLYDFLFDFYKENMDWTYIEDDPIVYRMVEALKSKLVANDEVDDDNFEISNKVYTFQEGIRKLVIYRTGYASTLISHMIHRIDDLINHTEQPAKLYVDELCDLWIEGRLRNAQESKTREQTKVNRGVAVDYTRIRPIYALIDETRVLMVFPDIRLRKTDFEKTILQVYVGDILVETRALSFYGNELGKTLSGFEIDISKCIRNGDGSLNVRAVLLCDDECIYDTKELMYRKVLCFSKKREIDITTCEKGSYSILLPSGMNIDFIGAEISEIDSASVFDSFFVRLEDGFLIRQGEDIIAFDQSEAEENSEIRVVLPKKYQEVNFQKKGKKYDVISSKDNIYVIVNHEYDYRKSRILMNGIQISLQDSSYENVGKDFIYKIPLETTEENTCEFKAIDFENNRVITIASLKYLPSISWRFNKSIYYNDQDYTNASIHLYYGTQGYTEGFSCDQNVVSVQTLDGIVEIKIPKLSIRNNNGELWDISKKIWIKDIQQSDKLYVSAPIGYEVKVKVGDTDVVSESRGTFAIGNAVYAHSTTDSIKWIDISVSVQTERDERSYVIGRNSEIERFVSSVKFDYRDQSLYWNRGAGFIGSKEEMISLVIRCSEGQKIYPLDVNNEIAIENVDMPIGEYDYAVVKASENIFSLEKVILQEGTLIVGDKNELRFRNYLIRITHITNEFEENFESIKIRGTYIEKIEYHGIQYVGSEERECPVYSGIMFYMGQSGKHHEFSYEEADREEDSVYEVNPVTIVFINEHTLSITNSDGQGIYYYRYFNKDRMENIYLLTDREPNARNKRNYNVADLYLFEKERL